MFLNNFAKERAMDLLRAVTEIEFSSQWRLPVFVAVVAGSFILMVVGMALLGRKLTHDSWEYDLQLLLLAYDKALEVERLRSPAMQAAEWLQDNGHLDDEAKQSLQLLAAVHSQKVRMDLAELVPDVLQRTGKYPPVRHKVIAIIFQVGALEDECNSLILCEKSARAGQASPSPST
jgi:hypothetical protein